MVTTILDLSIDLSMVLSIQVVADAWTGCGESKVVFILKPTPAYVWNEERESFELFKENNVLEYKCRNANSAYWTFDEWNKEWKKYREKFDEYEALCQDNLKEEDNSQKN